MSALSTSYFREDDAMERQFDQIIGQSAALEAVLEKVELVAPTASTVLISGRDRHREGTGGESDLIKDVVLLGAAIWSQGEALIPKETPTIES